MIQASPKEGSAYYNYKNAHSIVLMAVCDSQYCFTLVDIGDFGRHSDGGVFANSNFGKGVESNSIGLPNPQSTRFPHQLKISVCVCGGCCISFENKHYTTISWTIFGRTPSNI